MGYLTTITIRNDALNTIREHAEEFVEKLGRFCSAGGVRNEEHFSIGYHANPVVLQKPRHADDHTIYVHMGNTVVEMNPYSVKTREMAEFSPEFFDKVLKFMEKEVKDLKSLSKIINKERNK